MKEEKAENSKKRGVGRRIVSWTWRVLAYGVLAVCLVAAVALAVLQSSWFEGIMAEQLIAAFASVVDEEVSVDGVYIDLLGRRAMISGLRIHAADQERYPDPVHIDLILVDTRLTQILRGRILLERIIVHRPALRIVQDENGDNLPTLLQADQDQGGLEVEVNRLDVSRGEVEYNGQVFGWGISSGGIQIKAQNEGETAFRGEGVVENLLVEPPGSRSLLLNIDFNFLATPDRVNMRATMRDETGSAIAINRIGYDIARQELEAGFDFNIDLGLLDVNREADVAGIVKLDGQLHWSESGTSVEATVEADRVRYGDFFADYLFSDVRLEGENLIAENVRAGIAQGELRGSARIERLFGQANISAQVALDGIRIRDLLQRAGFGTIRVESIVDANFAVNWDTALPDPPIVNARLIGQIDEGLVQTWQENVADIRRDLFPDVFDSAVLPVSMDISVGFSEGKILIGEESSVSTPNAKIGIQGEIASEDFTIRVSSSAVDSAEASLALANLDRFFGALQPDLPQVYGTASFVRLFDAQGSLNLTLRGPIEKTVFDLNLRSNDVTFLEHSVGPGSGTIRLKDNVLSLENMRFGVGEGTLSLKGNVALPPIDAPIGTLPKTSLTVRAEQLPLDQVEWLLDPTESMKLAGTASGQLSVEFQDPAFPRGDGNLTIEQPRIFDAAARRAAFHLTFGDAWGLTDIDMVGTEGEIIAGDLILLPTDNEWRAELKIRNIDLADYAALFGEDTQLGGILEVDFSARGKKLAAWGDASFSLNKCTVAGVEFDKIAGTLKAEGREARLELSIGDEKFPITSRVGGEEFDTIEFSLQREEIDLTGLLLEYMPGTQFYLTVLDGVDATVRLGEDGVEQAEVVLGDVLFGLEQFSISSKQVKLALRDNNMLVFDDISFVQGGDESRTARLNGFVQLGGAGRVSLDVSGGINLFTLSDFFPDLTLGGEALVDLRLRGRLDQPSLDGSMNVLNGFLRHRPTNFSFADINGRLNLSGQRVELTSLSARFAQGSAIMDGVLTMNWSTLSPQSYRFTAEGTDLQLNVLEGLESTFNGTLAISGNMENTLISGDIVMPRAIYTRRFDPEAELTRFAQAAAPAAVPDETLRAIRLDIGIASGDDGIVIENNFAEAALKLDVRLVGSLAQPGVLGRAEVARGAVFYRDRKYDVTTGIIEFVNRNTIMPQFDFRAETRVKEYRVFLEFHGTLERLFPELSSDPNLSSIDIFHLLATGDVRDNPFPSENQKVQEQLLQLGLSGFLTKQITGEVERRAEQLFGIDRFRIDPFLLEESANPTARLTVGEQVTDELSIVYSTNLSREDQQVLVFEYKLSPSLLLVGTRENDGSFAVDIHLQQRFR